MIKNNNQKKTILITGENSRFSYFLKDDLKSYKTYFASKKDFDILSLKKMKNFIKDKKIKYLIHIVGILCTRFRSNFI